MPTYEYACQKCDTHFEVVHGFTEDGPEECPSCASRSLRKVFHPVGIVLKGSGFYKTDSRSASTASSPAATSATGSSSSDSPSSDSSSSESSSSDSASGESSEKSA